jgi:hypothetical protein
MSATAEKLKPRRLWMTVLLYVGLLSVLVTDVWAALFWRAVGGSLGLPLAIAAVVVVLALGALLLADARRQWRLYRWTQDPGTD